MQVNSKIISIPPYLSTTWQRVALLHVKKEPTHLVLVVTLTSGKEIEIPGLSSAFIENIFQAHAQSLQEAKNDPASAEAAGFKIALPLGSSFPELMQHNAEQMNSPDLPKEILEKIVVVAHSIGIDLSYFPKPEPHCNCLHCQLARAIHNPSEKTKSPDALALEEEVSEKDLSFREWDILPINSSLYSVTNPLDSNEQYNVFLGEPLGCTCGQKNCEHIRAVLKS